MFDGFRHIFLLADLHRRVFRERLDFIESPDHGVLYRLDVLRVPLVLQVVYLLFQRGDLRSQRLRLGYGAILHASTRFFAPSRAYFQGLGVRNVLRGFGSNLLDQVHVIDRHLFALHLLDGVSARHQFFRRRLHVGGFSLGQGEFLA